MHRNSAVRFGLAATAAIMLSICSARAEVHVSGSRNALVVEAKNASLAEVVAQLNAALKMQIVLKAPVDGVINGTYSGSLRRIFSRLLEGRNFVSRSNGDRITLVVLGPGIIKAGAFSPSPAPANVAQTSTAVDEEPVINLQTQGWGGFFSMKPSSVKSSN